MYSSPLPLSISDPTPSHSSSPSPPPLPAAIATSPANDQPHHFLRSLKPTATTADADGGAKLQLDRKDTVWSDVATACLLEAFEEKWVALRRGNLRSSNWEEVASRVGMRCGVSRTGEQCRHKMEKLRRKYREEKALRDRLCFGPSKWVWYERFEVMLGDHKPKEAEISACNDITRACNEIVRKNGGGEPADRGIMEATGMGLRPPFTMEGDVRVNGADLITLGEKIERDAASFTSTSQQREAPDGEGQEDHGGVAPPTKSKGVMGRRRKGGNSLLPAIKSFMDGMLRIEQHKLELQKDNERLRCEMELKRTELLVGLELKRTQMQLEMVKAVTRPKAKKAKTDPTDTAARSD